MQNSMTWRTIIITKQAKLDYKMGFMAVRSQSDITKIYINEIHTLIIESTFVSLTTALLSELAKNKVKVIFCDEKHNPSSELISYYGAHDTSAKIREQVKWKRSIKDAIWQGIVKNKIHQQMKHLEDLKISKYILLKEYMDQVEDGDSTNREGHAAKVYFNALFGNTFSRTDENGINASLNYGYGILLSIFNREIVASGYLTQLGIFHDNMFNQFNLSSDFMEPFRILIDRRVIELMPNELTKEVKYEIANIMNEYVIFDGQRTVINNAIKRYCKCIFDALASGDGSMVKFYKNEL